MLSTDVTVLSKDLTYMLTTDVTTTLARDTHIIYVKK